MADAVQSWSIDNILKKHLPHRGSVDGDDQNWDDKKDWISNIPAKKWPADPADCLSNACHEFGEHNGVNTFTIEASATFTVMEPYTMRTMFAGELDRRHFKPTVLNLGRQMAALEGISDISAVILQAAVMEGETRLKKGLMLVVDNTFTPMVVSPARSGADVVVHSVSKFISGGADIIADSRRVSKEEEEEPEGVKKEEEPTQLNVIELYLNSGTGLTSYTTMKMEGQVMGRTVVALIDSGASHNFAAQNLVQELGVRVDEQEGGVIFVSGLREKHSGICVGLTLSLQGIEITQNFLVMDLKCADLILGMQWLGTLGETKVNWKTLHFEYGQGEQRVVLRGDPKLVTSRSSTVTS